LPTSRNPTSTSDPAIVTREVLDRRLDEVRAAAAGATEGVFGPASLTWRIDREAAIFLGAGRALLLQLAHPWVAAAVAAHSQALSDPIGRFHRTFGIMFAMAFGTVDQALAAARQLHRRHAAITGILPEAAGPFAAGSAYCANDISALRWVNATLTETALYVHDLVRPPLTAEERERYHSESTLFAALFGIPRDRLPRNWAGFAAYCDEMHRSEVLTVTPTARAIATSVLAGAGSWLSSPEWYRALTASLLPERLRRAYELPFGAREQRSVERALHWIRRGYPLLPPRLRTVGPYQEAVARISGREGPTVVTQLLNQAWIGRATISD
jgi:uncharacterized protein (DUF2236 family)